MVAIFAIFYFVLIWPMRKRQKALQKLIENLKRGDKVVTNGGLYGEVAARRGPGPPPEDRRQRQGQGRPLVDRRARGRAEAEAKK